MHAGIRREVGGREVVLLRDLSHARPVLAEQRAVARRLVGVARRASRPCRAWPRRAAPAGRTARCPPGSASARPWSPAHPPPGRCGGRAPSSRSGPPAGSCRRAARRASPPTAAWRRRRGAASRRTSPPRRAAGCRLLVVDEPADVAAVAAGVVEAEPPDGVLDPEEVLEAERDPRRRPDEQDVVRDLLRIDVPGCGAVAVQPLRPPLARLVVEHLDLRVADLAAPVLDQGARPPPWTSSSSSSLKTTAQPASATTSRVDVERQPDRSARSARRAPASAG